MNESEIKPLNNNVLIRLIKPEGTFANSKLIKPDATKDEESFQCPTGTVIAVGPGKRTTKTGTRMPIDLKAGDTVVMRKHWKEKVNQFDETLVMVDADQVMAVMPVVGALT